MAEHRQTIEESSLPGIGMRFAFQLADGRESVVVVHTDGRRDVSLQSVADPDAYDQLLSLDESEARTMAELLGGSTVVRDLEGLRDEFAGLALEEVTVEAGSQAADQTIGELRVRASTGVTVVVVQSGEEVFLVPGPSLVLRAGDRVVAAGTSETLQALRDLVRGT